MEQIFISLKMVEENKRIEDGDNEKRKSKEIKQSQIKKTFTILSSNVSEKFQPIFQRLTKSQKDKKKIFVSKPFWRLSDNLTWFLFTPMREIP